jgi:peroxiredoxin
MLREGPVLLAFFKISCPTCQLTFPYLARLSETETRFVGISQDDAPSTRAFISRFAVGFDVVLDPATERYPVSNAYGITHVPTFFLIEPGGRIAAAWTGFSRAEMESLAARLRRPLFTAADQVPAWKAG